MRSSCITAALLALLLITSQGYCAPSGHDLLQKGLMQERAHGNLEEAIRLYTQIVDEYADDHALAATALLRVGACYEKLGRSEAEKAYQRIIDEYSDRKQEVAVARENLARLAAASKPEPGRPTFRKIDIASRPQNGVLSPNGTKLAFVSDGAVWVVPLQGKVGPDIAGEPVRLAEVPGIWDAGSLIAWSADGQWIAVNGWPDGEDAVYVIPATGGEPRVLSMPDRGGHAWSYRLSLSPDGQILAFSARGKDHSEASQTAERGYAVNRYIYTVPTTGGEPKQTSSNWARLPSFSPDGRFIAYVGYRRRHDWPGNTERGPYDGDLWVAPSTGGTPVKLAAVDGRLRGPIWSPDGTYIAAHYEPEHNNSSNEVRVYPLSSDVTSAGEPIKIALPYYSMDMLAGWTPDGELGGFGQTEEHRALYTVSASGGNAGQITPPSVGALYPRWSPDGKRIYFRAYYHEDRKHAFASVPPAGGVPSVVPLQPKPLLGVAVPGGGFRVSPDGRRIVLSGFQHPYDPNDGVDLWAFPSDGGTPTRLTNDRSFNKGHPCWSPDGQHIAFVDRYADPDGEDSYAIYTMSAEGGTPRRISSEADNVGDGGIAFSPDGERIAFFSEGTIKTIPVEGGETDILVPDIKSGRHSQLAYSPDGSRIAHNAAGKIWITSLDGRNPEELRTGLRADAQLGGFDWSPDGEKIVFLGITGGEAEFWLIGDFLPDTVLTSAK